MSTIGDLALVYEVTEGEVEQRMYAMAEQIHAKYCLAKGIVNHTDNRPDQDIALAVLGGLSAGNWYLMHKDPPAPQPDATPFVNFGDDTVMGSWAEDDDDAA